MILKINNLNHNKHKNKINNKILKKEKKDKQI